MKPKQIGKRLSLCLAATLVLSMLAACSGGSPSSSGSSAASSTASAASGSKAESPSSTADDGGDKELYEFSIFGANMGTELKEADLAYIKGLEEKLNIKLNAEIPPSSSYVESLQMMLASGDYADIFMVPDDQTKLRGDMVRDGVVIPVNDLIANAPNLMAYTYEISWDTLKLAGDDNIYGIPRTSIARADGFMLRKDWLDAVGVTVEEGKPLTIAQIEEIATLFTQNDPDGNGAADTYGIASNASAEGNIDLFFGPAFGLTGWKEYDGVPMDPKFDKNNDSYKRALAWHADMWKKGVVDPDWPTVQRDVSLERFKKGITGVIAEFSGWMSDTEIDGKKLNPDYELIYISGIVEEEGGKYTTATSSTGFWGSWQIASTAEKPERIIEMLDYALSDEYWSNGMYGFEGITYTKEGDSYAPIDLENDLGGAFGKGLLRRNNDPNFFISLKVSAEERTRIANLIDICIKQYEFPLDRGFRPAIADDPAFLDYEKNMKVQISKILVGDLPVDEWDVILDGWYAAGGETYIQQMRDHIASKA